MSILINFSVGLIITDVANFIIAMHKYISDLKIFKQFSYGLFQPELLITPKIMRAILARQNTVGDWNLDELIENLDDNSQTINKILMMNTLDISLEEIYLTNKIPENINVLNMVTVWRQIFETIKLTNSILKMTFVSDNIRKISFQGGNLNIFRQYIKNMPAKLSDKVFTIELTNFTFSSVINQKFLNKNINLSQVKKEKNFIDNQLIFTRFFKLMKSKKFQ